MWIMKRQKESVRFAAYGGVKYRALSGVLAISEQIACACSTKTTSTDVFNCENPLDAMQRVWSALGGCVLLLAGFHMARFRVVAILLDAVSNSGVFLPNKFCTLFSDHHCWRIGIA